MVQPRSSALVCFAYLAQRAVAPFGFALPAFALFGSLSLDLRVIRLRLELLALLLLLWTVHVLSERRARLAGICACAFALAYTAIHALLGVCTLRFALCYWIERKPSHGMIVVPVGSGGRATRRERALHGALADPRHLA